jgi:hypothetical protein
VACLTLTRQTATQPLPAPSPNPAEAEARRGGGRSAGMVVPFIDVSHLASASSFYSSILQPLGLSYVDVEHADPPLSVTYGFDGEPVLQIRQNPTPLGPLRLSSLVLTAPSRSAVVGFHDCGLRANPPLLLPGASRPWLTVDGGVAQAAVHDLDGNRMEAVYSPHSSVQYAGSAVRETQSTHEEVGRILDWNYDVASARPHPSITVASHHHAPPVSYQHQQHQHPPALDYRQTTTTTMSRRSEQPHYPLRRSMTHDPTTVSSASSSRPVQNHASKLQAQPMESDSPRQSSTSGMSTTTVLGALLGVAAGAAVTYGLVSHDRDRKPIQEHDPTPLLPRRSTFPDNVPMDRKSLYDDRNSTFGGFAYRKPGDNHYARSAVNDYPPQKRMDDYPPRKVVYADVVDDYDNVWSSPHPQRLMHGGPSYEQGYAKTIVPSRPPEDAYDTRSRHSSRSRVGRGLTVRTRSEAPADVEPTTYILDGRDQRGYAPSRHSAVPRSTHSHAPSRYPRNPYETERDTTYVSARTHRSSSTTRPPRVRVPVEEDPYYEDHEPVRRSRAPSKASVSRPPISGSQVSAGRSSRRARSQVSAREVPLPMSGIGSSHANWDDDLISLAPSDSISCVGSKSSRRSHRHHH